MQAVQLPKTVKVDIVASERASCWDDLSRNVYCVLGIPVDAIEMSDALQAFEAAVADRTRFVISTPNLNFLVLSQREAEFRETLLLSEFCLADGMPIIWISRLMGLPIKSRVAGSDFFETLMTTRRPRQALKLFLFGGAAGVAETAARVLNERSGGLRCVGFMSPGFGSVGELSRGPIIDEINASNADVLVAALGAKKGQLWLHRNRDRLQIPICAHLGATINFAAGTISRAPQILRQTGFEWLWRIKEEPHLWRRYWNDGRTFLSLLMTHVLPLAIGERWQRLIRRKPQDFVIESNPNKDTITLNVCGAANARNVDKAIPIFRDALARKMKIQINLSATSVIDARFLGLFLMLRKQATKQNATLSFTGASFRLRTLFWLNGAGFLLASDRST